MRELQHNELLPTAELLQLQQRKLAALLSFARAHVPYYRALFRDLALPVDGAINEQDFLRLPLLTKSIIRREKDALVSENLTHNRLRADSTSGSTGEPLQYFTDDRSLPYRKAAVFRSDTWTGWRLGDRVVRLWGAQIDQKRTAGLRGKLHGWITGDRFLSSFNLSAANMDRYIETIRSFNPVLLVGYPGPLEEFAVHCRERVVKLPSIKAIVSSSETLWPHQRETIEAAFRVKVFNRYGSREVSQIASECEVHEGLHISIDRHVLEIVDDDGQTCPPGVVGRILITDLDNFGMPMIRYDIGDRGALAEKQDCACGRGFPMLEKVEGRTLEIIRTPDGRSIGGTYWTLLLRTRPGLKQTQIVQHELGGIVIRYVRDAAFDKSVLDYFTKRIKEHCGEEFAVKFEETEFIDLTGSGKQRLIVSHLLDQADGGERDSCTLPEKR